MSQGDAVEILKENGGWLSEPEIERLANSDQFISPENLRKLRKHREVLWKCKKNTNGQLIYIYHYKEVTNN